MEIADTISDYMSSLKQEERGIAVAAASRPVVQKVVLGHRYGKNSLFALTDGIVFENRADRGRNDSLAPFKLKSLGYIKFQKPDKVCLV